MNTAYLLDMVRYSTWANKRVAEAAKTVPAEKFDAEVAYSVGSLQNQLVHTLSTESWVVSLVAKVLGTEHQLDLPKIETLTNADIIAATWEKISARYEALVAELSVEQLNQAVDLPTGHGAEVLPTTVFDTIMLTINHSTNHRAQILRVIHDHGGQTVEQGIFYYRHEGKHPAPKFEV